MWTATITKVESDANPLVAQVTYEYTCDDGRTKTVVERISDPNSLVSTAQNAIFGLNREDEIAALIKNPPLGVVNTAPVTSTTPSTI